MKKSRLRDVNLILEKSENTTQTECILVSKNLRQSNLNFEMKTLIRSSLKRLNVL